MGMRRSTHRFLAVCGVFMAQSAAAEWELNMTEPMEHFKRAMATGEVRRPDLFSLSLSSSFFVSIFFAKTDGVRFGVYNSLFPSQFRVVLHDHPCLGAHRALVDQKREKSREALGQDGSPRAH